MSAVLDRATVETSRALEYFSDKELRTQIGLDTAFWPLAILRELKRERLSHTLLAEQNVARGVVPSTRLLPKPASMPL